MKLKTKNIRIPNKEKFPRKLKKAIKCWIVGILSGYYQTNNGKNK